MSSAGGAVMEYHLAPVGRTVTAEGDQPPVIATELARFLSHFCILARWRPPRRNRLPSPRSGTRPSPCTGSDRSAVADLSGEIFSGEIEASGLVLQRRREDVTSGT